MTPLAFLPAAEYCRLVADLLVEGEDEAKTLRHDFGPGALAVLCCFLSLALA